MGELLAINHLSYSYHNLTQETQALEDVNFVDVKLNWIIFL